MFLILDEKIKTLETDVKQLKEAPSPNTYIPKGLRMNNCNSCDKEFEQNCQLEKRVVEIHGQEKSQHCDVCGKRRLNKHKKIHLEVPKFCHFLNNKKACPFY